MKLFFNPYRFLIIFFLWTLCAWSQKQLDNEAKDVKVGLVLSGGGAKGLAHIGVLKVIEEAGIRVDYIGGTSMGAIIGSLYASGYTASQLDSIIKTTDFNILIQDAIPRGAMGFYEKKQASRYAVTLPFDDLKVGLPSGISKGQNVYNLLSKLLSHVSDVNDFSQLSIPFLCIATDLETGQEVVIEDGYLPKAVAASGALPSLFSPVVIDDRVLIDGGVVNNYPINHLKEKGMDIIIGVDVQDALRTRDAIESGFDILLQINNFKTIEDMKQKQKDTDLYIRPDITDYSVVSFEKGAGIITTGERAANKNYQQLQAIAKDQSSTTRIKKKIPPKDFLTIDKVTIEGSQLYSRAYVLGKLKIKTPERVSYQDFKNGINNLSATGNYDSIDYRVVQNEAGNDEITFYLTESGNRTQLKLSAHYDELFNAAALANLTQKRILTNNDVASLDIIVGDNFRYKADYFIDKGYYWSIGVSSSFTHFEQDVSVALFSENELPDRPLINEIELDYNDFTNRLYFETIFNRSSLLGIGAEHKYLRFLSETIGIDEDLRPRTIFESTNYYSAFGYLNYDTLDDPFFPTKGLLFDGNIYLYLFAQGRNNNFEEFSIAQAKLGYAVTLIPTISLFAVTEGGITLGDTTNTKSLDFVLGGYGFQTVNNIIPFLGYEALSIRGNTYLKTSLTFDYEILPKNHIQLFGNIANVGDDLFLTKDWIDSIDHSALGVGYGLETFLGPIELKYAYSPKLNRGQGYIVAGFRF